MNKPHISIIFLGHVDCGKSTIGGNLLYLNGMISEREIDKLKRESVNLGRESWFLAYIMDQNDEEKEKGKTVEVGRAVFETEKRRYTILDAPGHKEHICNMISASAHADYAILVISARGGEFEIGFERSGQTREHVLLAKIMNVKKLIVLINKMDDKTVLWSEKRYNEICGKLSVFIKVNGFKKDVEYVPISGLYGDNLVKKSTISELDWYYEKNGKTFIETLDDLEYVNNSKNEGVIITILDKYVEQGKFYVISKIENGTLRKGDKLNILPTNKNIIVDQIYTEFSEKPIEDNVVLNSGEIVYIVIKGLDINDIHPGFILCDNKSNLQPTREFKAVIKVIEKGPSTEVLTKGSRAMMHLSTLTCEVEIEKVLSVESMKVTNGKKEKISSKSPFVRKGSTGHIILKIANGQTICCSKKEICAAISNFALRDGDKTIAVGQIVGIKPVN